jgi:hypothetical protein
MTTQSRFKIIEFKNPGNSIAYRVTGCTKEGKQLRKNFASITEATLFQQDCEREYLGLAKPVMEAQTTRLSESEVKDAETALALLTQKMPAWTLTGSVEWFLANYRPSQNARPLHEAVHRSPFALRKTLSVAKRPSIA